MLPLVLELLVSGTLQSAIRSNNSLVHLAAKCCLSGNGSAVSNTLAVIRYQFNISDNFIISGHKLPSAGPLIESTTAHAIRDFCIARYNVPMDWHILTDIIEYLCIS